MTIEDDIVFLEKVPTLSVLGRAALRILAIGAESRYVHHDEVLFNAGDTADAGYVVQEGSFTLNGNNADGGGAVLGVGSLIGELALLTETKRPVTAVAREPSTVIRISRSLFLKMLEGYPEAAHRMREAMAARADQTSREIVNIRAALDSVRRSR